MKKLIFIFVFLLILIPLISAYTFTWDFGIMTQQQNECFEFPAACDNCTYTNITILYPNGTIAVDNEPMTNPTSIYYYNYTFCDTSTLGIYPVITNYDEEEYLRAYSDFNFFVITESGYNIDEGNATTIYTIVLFFMVLASLFFYAFFKNKGKFQVKWIFFIVGYIFFLSALSLSILALRDSLVNPSIITFLDSFMAIAFILFWFAFGLLFVMWFLTMLQTILFNKKKSDKMKYG